MIPAINSTGYTGYGGLAGGGVVLLCVLIAVFFLVCITSKHKYKHKFKRSNSQESTFLARTISSKSHASTRDKERVRHSSFSLTDQPTKKSRPRFSSLSTIELGNHSERGQWVQGGGPVPSATSRVPLHPLVLVPEAVDELSDDRDADASVFVSPTGLTLSSPLCRHTGAQNSSRANDVDSCDPLDSSTRTSLL